MTEFLVIALPIVLAAVVLSLILGLKSLAGNEESDRRRSNRLMQWRVGLQELAVLIMLALIALAS